MAQQPARPMTQGPSSSAGSPEAGGPETGGPAAASSATASSATAGSATASSVAGMATTVRTNAAAAKAATRDYRLDFFRGLALVFIFIDHIPDNIVSFFTLRSFAFCDAAEVFIFISGYTAALAYAPVFGREGTAMGVARIYRRVWQLYVAHLCLFMIFTAEVAYTLKYLQNPLFADELQVGDYLQNQGETFIRVLLLQFQPSLLNILPLYILLLLALPPLILLIRRHILLGLIPSAALYLAANLLGWNLPGFPEGRWWFFNPLSWQFLFTIGVTLGFVRSLGGRWLRSIPGLPVVAAIIVVAAGALQFAWILHEPFNLIPYYLPLPDPWLDKTMLPPARLVSLLALAVVVGAYVPRDARFMKSTAGWVIVLCGQNSLEVFCLGILLSVLANFVLSLAGYGLFDQFLVNLGGLAIMFAFGLLLAWFKAGGRLPAAPRPENAS